ncbi:hypothetical protein F3Y22_tig00007099pilonHSYRG00021 [Hibiscus syriacus]|uniref:rRNA N-glycosylase n=1 Tax=Hibiscus syriacus TaxID=106335 RepID=A0A6A3CB03_HIBSY|nr:hypothetical protein F3Y22_tig00007099pilonHSYRG00021 [Hibiscus syriacus]
MKVLAIAVLLACWASAVEPQKPSIYTLRFTATDATKGRYDAFMIDLRRVLTLNENAVQGIPVLPSTNDLKPTDLNRYDALEGKAGEDRDKIPLGFAELHQKIENLNHYKPKDDIKKVASSLLVCFQMISEAARYKYIQQQIAALAPVVPGGAGKSLKPDALMKGYQNNWGQLSTAVQSAKPDASFVKSVTVAHLTYSNVAAVRPVIAVLLKDSPTAYHAAALLDRFIDQALTQI